MRSDKIAVLFLCVTVTHRTPEADARFQRQRRHLSIMSSTFLLLCLTALCGRVLSFSTSSSSQSPADFEDAVRRAFARVDRDIARKHADRQRQRRNANWAHEMQQDKKSRNLHETQERFEEATKILLNEYNLSPEEVFATHDLKNMLPREAVEECQRQLAVSTCDPNYKYRTIDGQCNNMHHPTWGMAWSCFPRLTKAYYTDGLSTDRKAVSGNDLPTPRHVSLKIHSYLDKPSYHQTHMFMAFGQFLDHDITLTPFSSLPIETDCCSPQEQDNNPDCHPELIAADDPFYGQYGITCLNDVRSAACPTCSLSPRQQINRMTAYIDASHVYDVDVNASRNLRSLDGTGTLRFQTSAVAGELLPPSQGSREDLCTYFSNDYANKCFLTGDVRGTQHPATASLQTMLLREHNRIARALMSMTSGWSDEQIFQEARRIVGAEMQMITYNEFLPHVLGPERMRNLDLNIRGDGYTVYNDSLQTSLVNEFSAACYRFGHTLVNGLFREVGRDSTSCFRLKDTFFYPEGLFHGQMDRVLKGLTVSPRQSADRYFVTDLTNHLLQIRGNDSSGLDLAAVNINRGRDHGIPPYIDMVKFCGGPSITNFRQLDKLFHEGYSSIFQRTYENVADIDLYSGGLGEKPVPGGVVGPTFACVIGTQFHRLKFGDRFYFEHGGQTGSFTPDQLREVRKVSLSKLMCDNTEIEKMQPKAMLFPCKSNLVQNCKDLPGIDLKFWIE